MTIATVLCSHIPASRANDDDVCCPRSCTAATKSNCGTPLHVPAILLVERDVHSTTTTSTSTTTTATTTTTTTLTKRYILGVWTSNISLSSMSIATASGTCLRSSLPATDHTLASNFYERSSVLTTRRRFTTLAAPNHEPSTTYHRLAVRRAGQPWTMSGGPRRDPMQSVALFPELEPTAHKEHHHVERLLAEP